MNNYGKNFNQAYEKFTPQWLSDPNKVDQYIELNCQTLIEFYEDYSKQFNFPQKDYSKLRVLDLGTGLGGVAHYFARKGAEVVGVDVSNLAIMAAQQIAQERDLDISFKVLDVTNTMEDLGSFDLIMDSHLYHCLISDEDRNSYLTFVKKHLQSDGLFLMESMVFQKQFRTPVGYSMDENFTLYKEFSDGERAIRRVIPGIELEKEFKVAGLNIHYLYFHAELSFEVFDDYEGYPHQNLPQTARLAAKF
ncbi:MAG: class I SAM-dependent methyltransferase [Bacteriovoracaceae bacterium]|nr:class I SAM-dependent methyltransferase [Bacteriovoracaceae bacterium]